MRPAPLMFYKFLLILSMLSIYVYFSEILIRENFMASNETPIERNTMPNPQPTLEDFGNGIFIIWI